MAHQRQLIREAVKAQLVGTAPTYRTGAGARVYETRMAPFRRLELPAIAVYVLEESIDPASKSRAPRELTRNLQLQVVAVVEASAAVDDAMDAIALEIERALDADRWFGGTAGDSILSSVQMGIDDEGGKPVGAVQMVYAVTYRTDAPSAADLPPLPDFSKAHVETSLGGGVHPANRAVDDVAVPIV